MRLAVSFTYRIVFLCDTYLILLYDMHIALFFMILCFSMLNLSHSPL